MSDTLPEFPKESVNENGEIISIDLYVDEFKEYFEAKIVSEIRTTIEANLKTAPYILISCAIDFLVTFWAGADSTRTRYKNFVDTYFVGYRGENLYRELRCRMVHNHTVGESTIICWDEPDLHKKVTDDDSTVINLAEFFQDFIQAVEYYFSALRIDPVLLNNQIKRFNEMGVLCNINPNDIRASLTNR